MALYFEPAGDDVIDLAADLIERWHKSLRDANIGFLFRSESQGKRGRDVLAAIGKVPPTVAALAHLDYTIWISKPDWERFNLAQRTALLDHELCHAVINENGEWSLQDHDVQEFYSVIERHGLWKSDLRDLATFVTAAQARFPEFEEPEERPARGGVFAVTSQQARAIAGKIDALLPGVEVPA